MQTCRPARVAFLIDDVKSAAGGTEGQITALLRSLDRGIVRPYLLFLGAHADEGSPEFGVEPMELHVRKILSTGCLRGISKLINIIRDAHIDVLESHFVDASLFACAAALWLPQVVLISARRNQGYWRTPRYKMTFALLNRRVDLFLANCRATADWISRSERIRRERIHVIHNGVDLSRFDYDREEVRAGYRALLGLPPDAFVMGAVANLRAPKALDVFLRAARLVSSEIPHSRFLVVGSGPQMNELVSMAGTLGIGDKVQFLGRRDDVPQLLAAFDVGVLSSSSESFSNSILEYMAARLPVVCTDVGGAREAVEEGVTGRLVPPGDPEALADAVARVALGGRGRIMGERGRARVEAEFSMETMVRKYERLYVALARAGRRGTAAVTDTADGDGR